MSTGAQNEKGIPFRYPSTALLCVDSDDAAEFNKLYPATLQYEAGFRNDLANPAQVQINKQKPLSFGYMTRVSLTDVNIIWDVPNVNDYNKTLTFALWDISASATPTYPGISGELLGYRRVTLGTAFYTLPEIASSLYTNLTTQIPSISGTTLSWVVAANTTTATISIALGSSGSKKVAFQIIAGDVGRSPIDASGSYIGPVDDDLTYMLGLTPSVVYRTESATTGAALNKVPWFNAITSSYSPMQYTPYVDIQSNILTKNQNVQDGDSSSQTKPAKLARIYLANEQIVERTVTADFSGSTLVASYDNAIGCRPFQFHREFNTPKQIMWNTTENIDVVDLTVVDHKGRVVYGRPTLSLNVYDPGTSSYGCINGDTTGFQFTVQVSET
jgi:hypothetical protein